MKKPMLFPAFMLLFLTISTSTANLFAKDKPKKETATAVDSAQMMLDQIESTMKYQTGKVTIGDNLATINVPEGFHFLSKENAQTVVYDLWGNPREGDEVLGLLLPKTMKVTSSDTWAFVVEYDGMGYVKDDDAGSINYDDMLKDMQSGEADENKQRKAQGFPTAHLVGWAQKPYYDKDKRVLHWAKEIDFEGSEEHTLNYNVRVLGRSGVLVLNAVGNMSQLPEISPKIPNVLSSVEFAQGNRYADFNPSVDKVAAVTVGGLVAGKVLAKTGLLALIAKFGKVIFVAIAAAGGAVWKFITGRKDEETAAE